MRIVALLAVRNEELYIEKCIKHLIDQGIDICLIDNGSTDKTLEYAKQFLNKGLFRIETLPFKGYSDLFERLKFKEKLCLEIDSDWFIHHDADEIREAPPPYKTLFEGIMDVDKKGYNVINFDEFVFIPTETDVSFENTDYVNEMKHYYYFSRGPLRRMNAWKNTLSPVDISQSGGHKILFDKMRIFPHNFILRHYIFLSYSHGIRKYNNKKYLKKAVEEFGWHEERAFFKPGDFTLPTAAQMKTLSKDRDFDRSDPIIRHPFFRSNIWLR